MRSLNYVLPLALLSYAAPSFATTYQVGPNRTLKTIDAAASQLKPGDIVEVDGNATYAGGIVLDQPGAAGNPITVRGIRVNGKRPVLSGETNTIEIQGDHYVLEGFEVTQASTRCVFHHSDDVVMRDLVVHDCKAHGLLGADTDSGSLTLEYSEFYNSGSGTQDHQIYMATDEVAHPGSVFRMQHCYVHDGAGGNNVKSRAERNEIYYNWIEGAVYHELELIGPDPDGAPSGWTEDLKREDSDVVGNVLRKTKTSFVVRFGGDGTGQSNGRYRFVANTVLTQPGSSAVFRLFDGLESVEMHDNVFFVDPTPSGAVTIVRDSDAVWSTGTRIVGGSHNWVPSQASGVPSEWTATTKGSDPQFASVSALDLHPVANGPLAGACTCISSPAGHDFPSPLAWPAFEPPPHALEAVGQAMSRSDSGTLYVGAYQPAGSSSGPGGTGGATGNGGATSTGGVTGTGGDASSGGTNGSGGRMGRGGRVGSGGRSGSSGGDASSGGSSAAGTTGAGGTPSIGSGGSDTGSGGRADGGGGSATLSSGGADQGGAAGGNAADAEPSSVDGGCKCHIGMARTPASQNALGVLFAAGLVALRRRSRGRSARTSGPTT